MKNNISVKDNLTDLISKIGEKITLRRTKYFDKKMEKIFIMFMELLKKILEKLYQ